MIEIVSDRHSGATRADRTIHRNAPLTAEGRRRLVDRCRTRPIAHVAAEMGISRATASKRVNRYKQFGDLGLLDRSSTPLRQFTATDGAVVARIERMRRDHKWSADRIEFELPDPVAAWSRSSQISRPERGVEPRTAADHCRTSWPHGSC